jgi:hypothetical protein
MNRATASLERERCESRGRVERFGRRWLGAGAFTVLELMVAIGAMTLIVLVLYSLFDQTQRAMRGNVAQVDVLEGARATMEMLTSDIEQLAPSGVAGCTNLHVRMLLPPMQLGLAGPKPVQDAVLQEFFLLSPVGKHWTQIAYMVLPYRVGNDERPVGTLYRIALSNHVADMRSNSLWGAVVNGQRINTTYFLERNKLLLNRTNDLFQRVSDGVVHLRLRAYTTNGMAIWRSDPWASNPSTNNVYANRDPLSGPRLPDDPYEIQYAFLDDAVPAYLELELGVLEPQAFEQIKSMPNPGMAYRHLTNQAGRVHVFHQRIPIRTAR